jgi:hypothetical protein
MPKNNSILSNSNEYFQKDHESYRKQLHSLNLQTIIIFYKDI